MPGSRVVHRAQAIGGRMPPVWRDSGGPEGRQITSLPPSGFHRPSRQDAGVGLACPTSMCEPQDAASTRHREPRSRVRFTPHTAHRGAEGADGTDRVE